MNRKQTTTATKKKKSIKKNKTKETKRNQVFDGHPPGGWVDEYKKVGGQSVIVVTGNSTQRNVAKSP